jgi:serine protease inhibitor
MENIDSFVTLNIENSIWYKEGFDVKSDFLNTNEGVFEAEIEGLDFTKADAADTINNWISNATNGMIEKMIDPPLSGVMYLINAICFKGAWTNPFNPKSTQKSTFTTESGKNNTVDLMQADGITEFGKGTDYSVIRLPYENKKVSMYCILPAKDLNIDNFISGLSVAKFNELQHAVQADFSGIATEPIWVDDVLHKAIIDVNEQGTVAAAATVVINETAVRENFHADRPFVFLIVDDSTGSILFMGKAADLAEY